MGIVACLGIGIIRLEVLACEQLVKCIRPSFLRKFSDIIYFNFNGIPHKKNQLRLIKRQSKNTPPDIGQIFNLISEKIVEGFSSKVTANIEELSCCKKVGYSILRDPPNPDMILGSRFKILIGCLFP
jgi:hypothetical protein